MTARDPRGRRGGQHGEEHAADVDLPAPPGPVAVGEGLEGRDALAESSARDVEKKLGRERDPLDPIHG
eukprot:768058-Hanusia_phi.AAC.10